MDTARSVDRARRLLGVTSAASEQDVADARRRLAKQYHPDAGGSQLQMQQVNEAAAVLLASMKGTTELPGSRPSQRSASTQQAPTSRRPAPRRARSDHPSFTIEVLPVDAFIGLTEAARHLGAVVDDDPPDELDVVLDTPMRCWCRLMLVPDAGASTVSLTVAPVEGATPPDIDDVRDLWVAALNELDWDRIVPPPPS